MNETDDPAAKNEQELNLFSDQPDPESIPQAEPESVLNDHDSPAPETSEQQESDADAGIRTDQNAESVPNERFEQETASAETVATPAATTVKEDSPVVAPPPPRKQPAHARPGIVLPRIGNVSPSQSSSTAPASADQKQKPLPLHTLQPSQSLGQMLAAIRKARGMSLEEVRLVTRLRMEHLLELENDEIQNHFPPVYISAYVRELIKLYELLKTDADVVLEKMRGDTPQDPEALPEKLIESVNEKALVNEGESKRIRNITIIICVVIGIILVALIWLVILMVAKYAGSSTTDPGHNPPAMESGTLQPAEEPVSRTVRLDESELDALIVPETPAISVLKMSKSPGVRDSL